ncbi:hypothetical protein [Nocardia transvalensis]|uniref:hypothetical protein n=1 Tax=Nocardia transvalensis TaxID=37333 RepID=UPI001893267B|nr:hypothetical protein [Nocardia transvalensis]MBF6334248.1 hypothetical protein [Nocardia transvalensis]
MITTTTVACASEIGRPGPDTLVLANRKLRPGTDHSLLSRFGQDRWVLTPAVLHKHANATATDFGEVPEQFRGPVKHMVWLLLNHDFTSTALAYQFTAAQPAVSTVIERAVTTAMLGNQGQFRHRSHRSRRAQHRVAQLEQLIAARSQTREELAPHA